MADDWRIHIELAEEEHASGLFERLGLELGAEARELAQELEHERLAVSRDGNELFVYASSWPAADKAHAVIAAELRELGIEGHESRVEHWLENEERWDDEPKGESWEEEELDRGYAPWEVRVQCTSRAEANALAAKLEAEGYKPARTFDYVIAGCGTREDAAALAERLHGEVEPGGELVYEVAPGNPFAVFGGLGG
ncbi:MAG TPA: SPOR domain-containing protein [Gaiellaceae bacterium]|nr:SPOR domain-containing protein [Gaiellaceae bacterium]